MPPTQRFAVPEAVVLYDTVALAVVLATTATVCVVGLTVKVDPQDAEVFWASMV
jgi:hypothetical protein